MALPRDQFDGHGYEAHAMADAVRGSDALLSALRDHHDFNLRPPVSWNAKPKPLPQPMRPKRKQWFRLVEEKPRQPRISEVKEAVAEYFKLDVSTLDAERRTLRIVYPRQIGFFLCSSLTGHSLPEIGRRFGGRDHTTVLHGARKIEQLVKTDWIVAYDVAHVEALI